MRMSWALHLHCDPSMDACRIRTQCEPRPDSAPMTMLGIERDRNSALSRDDSAIPVEIITGEVTSPYPVGLCDDLCSLSCCRPRTALQ